MSTDTILYQKTVGSRTWKIKPGDTTFALVPELYCVELWENDVRIFDAGGFLTVDLAKKKIAGDIASLRAFEKHHRAKGTVIHEQQIGPRKVQVRTDAGCYLVDVLSGELVAATHQFDTQERALFAAAKLIRLMKEGKI